MFLALDQSNTGALPIASKYDLYLEEIFCIISLVTACLTLDKSCPSSAAFIEGPKLNNLSASFINVLRFSSKPLLSLLVVFP